MVAEGLHELLLHNDTRAAKGEIVMLDSLGWSLQSTQDHVDWETQLVFHISIPLLIHFSGFSDIDMRLRTY